MDQPKPKRRLMAEIREAVQKVMREKNVTPDQAEEMFLGRHYSRRPIRPTLIEFETDEEYNDFMERFYSGKSINEDRMEQIREELRKRRIAKDKR